MYRCIDTEIKAWKETEQLLLKQLEEAERRFSLSESLRTAGMVASTSIDSAKAIDIILEQARQHIEFDVAAIRSVRRRGADLIMRYPADGPPLPKHGAGSPITEVIQDRSPRIGDPVGEGGIYRSWMGIPLILRRELLGVLEYWRKEPDGFQGNQLWPAVAFSDTIAVALSNQRRYLSLLEEARTDPLTGLYSRRYFDERARNSLLYLGENNHFASLIILDIDQFKNFNDKYGHLCGDEVLRIVAEVFRRTLRHEDIVCRFGGEEFLALIPGVPLKRGVAVADRLRLCLEASRIPGIEENVTASFGVAEFCPTAPEPLQELIMRADLAMYQAKDSGRNRVCASERNHLTRNPDQTT
ncbi:MAG: sensor domain-containing diguanylate cyclase [Treponemataceae bacterium]